MGSPYLNYPHTPTWDRRGGSGSTSYDKNRMPREPVSGVQSAIPIQRTRKRRSKCPFMAKVLSCSI